MGDIYLENYISPDTFFQFKIGSPLDLTSFKVEIDYNPIGDNTNAYYFFDREVDVEVSTNGGIINSFDILMQNQENHLFLGDSNKRRFNLNNCNAENLKSYLKINKLKFEINEEEQVIWIRYFQVLTITFYFDKYSNSTTKLSLIGITK
ncbi:hypothetical protein DC498_12875 [Terrimonas sp.]|uniref:hypothetical protein n=1 Tax=Terrimonas sp. TaxID=1914338 RepID=UPI000D509E1D|nr:hypothetical protein [Terrimonas sp.]PVD51931.1 hypothetical protein DC498_12875 [Terrimonas sp.]